MALASLTPELLPSDSAADLDPQTQHRMQIVKFWNIPPGSRVLELGCGQGDTTKVLARVVGNTGHVDAVDPGSPDYGTPPLKDAQGDILSSPLGSRISFHHATATLYASSYNGPAYDYIVLAHSIWYFENPSVLPALVRELGKLLDKERNTKLCIAEWSLRSRKLSGVPHVWTALLRSLVEARRLSPSSANIRTVLAPSQIKNAVTSDTELRMLREEIMETGEGMQDGLWEVGYTLRKREADMRRLDERGIGEGEQIQVEAYFEAIQAAVDTLGHVNEVKCMDVWIAVFGR